MQWIFKTKRYLKNKYEINIIFQTPWGNLRSFKNFWKYCVNIDVWDRFDFCPNLWLVSICSENKLFCCCVSYLNDLEYSYGAGMMLFWTTVLGEGCKSRGVLSALGKFLNLRVLKMQFGATYFCWESLKCNLVLHIVQILRKIYWKYLIFPTEQKGVFVLE